MMQHLHIAELTPPPSRTMCTSSPPDSNDVDEDETTDSPDVLSLPPLRTATGASRKPPPPSSVDNPPNNSSFASIIAKRITNLLTSRVTICNYNSVSVDDPLLREEPSALVEDLSARSASPPTDTAKEFMLDGFLCDGCLFFYMAHNIYPRPPVLRRQNNMGNSFYLAPALVDANRCKRCGMIA